MKVIVSTVIKTSAEHMWRKLQQVTSLIYVASPILIFRSRDKSAMAECWSVDREYLLSIFLFGFIPLGKHVIRILQIDTRNMKIQSNEFGLLTRTWNHSLKITRIDNVKIRYTDEIDIDAGPLTAGLWLFAQIFYRHRQKRWKNLLRF